MELNELTVNLMQEILEITISMVTYKNGKILEEQEILKSDLKTRSFAEKFDGIRRGI